ncbi:hypothetical protein ACFX13_005171 [Malus domestica]
MMKTMPLPIPKNLIKIWDVWNLRGCILLSLAIQVFLTFSAPFRQQCRSKLLLGLIWSAYLLSDWVAAVSIGIIAKSQTQNCGSRKNEDLLAFWASFLLVHLGGPDTITSFALEDNEFWLRHLIQLILQVLAAAFSFYMTLVENRLWIPTILVFVAGTIKFGERTCCLYLASLDHFGETVLSKPEPGPDYEEAVDIYSTMRSVKVEMPPTRPLHTGKGNNHKKNPKFTVDGVRKESLDDMQLLRESYRFFESFKGLIVGFLLSSKDRERSRDFFLKRTPISAFQLIEYELSFMYEVLHTKVVVARHKIGYLLRLFTFCSTIGALILFILVEKDEFEKDEFEKDEFGKFDIVLTFLLLGVAIVLDILSVLLKLIFSDWTIIALRNNWSQRYIPSWILKRRRWSGSVSQYNMIRNCLDERPEWVFTIGGYVGVRGILDKIKVSFFSSSEKFTDELKGFVFKQLRIKSLEANNRRTAMEACSQRGDWALLLTSDYVKFKWSVGEYQYAESVLLWHIATELCFAKNLKDADEIRKILKDADEGRKISEDADERRKILEDAHERRKILEDADERRKICKILSDYMFYLLVMQHKMMAPFLGNWHIVFQDTCAEAKRFFSKHSISDHQNACAKITDVKAKFRSAAVKGSKSKSVLFDACVLAGELGNVERDPWKLMSRVWVELLSYASIKCRPIVHAQQPSRGGELLTFTWLLMYHLGLGTQFYELENPAAKMFLLDYLLSSTMSTRELFTTSFQSPYVSLDLLSYVKSGQVTPFQIFNEVIMPDFQYHISKDKPLLEKHKSSSSTNSEEDYSSGYLQTLQKIQSDLIYIGKACSRLKQWEDLVNGAIRELVLQSLDDAFKERTETLENSTKTNFLHNKLDRVLKIISSLKESLQLPSVNLNSESFRLSMTRAEDNLHHSLAELQEVNSHNITGESSAFKETEAAYKDLDENRQHCFLCFSVFPENAIIKKKVLVHWWVGEESIDEKMANEFFKEFTEKGLIKPVYKKRRPSADSCTMDPSTRYAVIRLAEKAQFINFNTDGNPTEYFTCSRWECLVKTEEGSSILELPFHLKQENVLSMINVNEPDLEFRPDWFSKMKNVRVLQLGRWQSSAEHLIQVEDSDFLKGLKNMRHLRYLSLRGVSGITELPAAVCKLSNLRILNLNGCLNLEKIPRGIGSLKNLTHLDMYECYLISHMPKGLALLSQLQVLKGFVIDEPKPAGGGSQPCKLADLSRLQHLRKLSIHVDVNKMSDAVKRELISLADFENLRSLSISWSRLYGHRKPQPLQRRLTNKLASLSKLKSTKSSLSSMPPVSSSTPSVSPWRPVLLEKLNLHYFPDSKIPDWLMQWKLDELKKLHIRGGKLSDLRHREQCQWKVEVLRLKFLGELQMDWPSLQELFPKLNYLEIYKCPKLISSMPCDHEGVWEKADSKQEEASNSNHH